MESGLIVAGQMFLDATYEGDLMAAAGVTYTVGRESNQQYGETLNGVQTQQNTHNHRFIERVDPYVVPGDPASGLLPGMQPGTPGPEGTARPTRASLLLSHVHDTGAGEPRALPAAGRL